MELIFHEDAEKDFSQLDKTLRIYFWNHIQKLKENPKIGRHLKFGVQFYVEDVTKQGR